MGVTLASFTPATTTSMCSLIAVKLANPTIPAVGVHVGNTVTVTPGIYIAYQPVITYQWQTSVDGVIWVNIPAATGNTFLVAVGQVGLSLAVLETVTTSGGVVSTRTNLVAVTL